MKLAKFFALTFLALTLPVSTVFAAGLIAESTIKAQKELTSQQRLKNGINVTIREIGGSDIFAISVGFKGGMRDLPAGRKSLNRWLYSSMHAGAEGYPKKKIYGLLEQYSINLGCTGNVEMSTCFVSSIDDYWKVALPMFAAVIKKPALVEQDVNMQKDKLIGSLKNVPQDPDTYANEIVNRIYYPAGYPYRLNHEEALDELTKLNRADLLAYHHDQLNAANMEIVVVTSLPKAKVMKDLEQAFGSIPKAATHYTHLNETPFDANTSFLLEDRDIPTAYIRAKFDAPAVDDKDAIGSKLMFEVLGEELGDEIRTKRSLSYSVYSYVIQLTKGIGVLGASTSKPEETLKAMTEVVTRLKTHDYSVEELNQYKNVFATNYFLTQETHASLADALLNTVIYFGKPDRLYEMPRELDKITPADIKRLANQILVNMRVGMVFSREKFKDEWAKGLITTHSKPVR